MTIPASIPRYHSNLQNRIICMSLLPRNWMRFSKLQRNTRRLALQKCTFCGPSFLSKNRVVTNHPICSQWKFSISGRPSCSLWSQLGNASGSGLSDSSLDSWTTAARRLAQASPGAIERSLGRNPPQVDVMQLESSVTHPVIEVPDDSQIPKVGWFVPS